MGKGEGCSRQLTASSGCGMREGDKGTYSHQREEGQSLNFRCTLLVAPFLPSRRPKWYQAGISPSYYIKRRERNQ